MTENHRTSNAPVTGNAASPNDWLSELTQADLSRAVFYGLLCGATSLIPVPLLDDWILTVIRRLMARELLERAGISLTPQQVRCLMRQPSQWRDRGCLSMAAYILVIGPVSIGWYLIKKIFRKILILFMLKEATDRAVWSFHEGYLLVLSGRNRPGKPGALDDVRLVALREALIETLQTTDTSAVSHVFRGVIRLNQRTLTQAGRVLLKTWRRLRMRLSEPARDKSEAIQQEESLLENMAQDTTEQILEEQTHLKALEQRFWMQVRRRGFFSETERSFAK